MFVDQLHIRVRYGDTDQMGYVYYGNYAYYYEQGRSEALRKSGITYRDIEESGVMMPVTKMNVRFAQPARYDELLLIETIIEEMPGRLISFNYRIFNEQGEKINEGFTQLAFINRETGKMQSAPEMLLEKLRPYFL